MHLARRTLWTLTKIRQISEGTTIALIIGEERCNITSSKTAIAEPSSFTIYKRTGKKTHGPVVAEEASERNQLCSRSG